MMFEDDDRDSLEEALRAEANENQLIGWAQALDAAYARGEAPPAPHTVVALSMLRQSQIPGGRALHAIFGLPVHPVQEVDPRRLTAGMFIDVAALVNEVDGLPVPGLFAEEEDGTVMLVLDNRHSGQYIRLTCPSSAAIFAWDGQRTFISIENAPAEWAALAFHEQIMPFLLGAGYSAEILERLASSTNIIYNRMADLQRDLDAARSLLHPDQQRFVNWLVNFADALESALPDEVWYGDPDDGAPRAHPLLVRWLTNYGLDHEAFRTWLSEQDADRVFYLAGTTYQVPLNEITAALTGWEDPHEFRVKEQPLVTFLIERALAAQPTPAFTVARLEPPLDWAWAPMFVAALAGRSQISIAEARIVLDAVTLYRPW